MAQKKYGIDLQSFIRSISLETFTVTDVTRYLLQIHVTLFDKKKNATQFVYRHLKALERQGVIKTLTTIKKLSFSVDQTMRNPLIKDSLPLESKSYEHIISKLKEKTRSYEAEMLTNIGETEAYTEWVNEMPELADDIKPQYQQTREQSKVMLGKVKGFERLLAQYEARL